MDDGLYVLDMDGMQQSVVDLSEPTNLVFDYMRCMATVLDAMPEGRLRVVHVGGAAMTMARYLAATRRGSQQVVFEPLGELVDRVMAEAPLPERSGIDVRIVTGQEGVASLVAQSWDVVILDAFEGGLVPDALTSQAFVKQVRGVLEPEGVFLANLVDKAPFDQVRGLVSFARDLGSLVVGMENETFKGRNSGNVFIASGAVPQRFLSDISESEYRFWTGEDLVRDFGPRKQRK